MYKLYCIFDKVAGRFDERTFTFSTSDGGYVRDILPFVINSKPLPDLVPMQIGEFDVFKGVTKVLKKPRSFSFDCYKFPENQASNLAPLGLSPAEVENLFKQKVDNDDKQLDSEISNPITPETIESEVN